MPLKSRLFRSWLFALLGVVLVLGSVGLSPVSPAKAASCRQVGAYTDYSPKNIHNAQPSLFIWNGSVRPEWTKLTISYNNGLFWERVPSGKDNGDFGVRTDAPWLENSSGWYGYFIATRWYSVHPGWNDDWRWYVQYCG
jgi:hypothetical protein